MTTGTNGSNAILYPYFTGSGEYQTWVGADGRTEMYAGFPRAKWNDYTCMKGWRRRPKNNFTVRYKFNENDPSEPMKIGDLGFFADFANPYTFSSNDQLRLLQRLAEQVKAHDFNLAVSLGELTRTVSMVSSTLSKLGKSISALKRGDFSTAARQLGARPRTSRLKSGDVSGRWLELQYGWLPLLSDCYEATKAYEAISNGPRSALFRTGIKYKGLASSPAGDGPLISVKVNYAKYRYLQYEMYEEMSAARSVGLLDPLSVLWELTPYSFVADWFIPIGSYIDLVNTIPFLKGRFLTTDVERQAGFIETIPDLPKRIGDWYIYEVVAPPQDVGRLVTLTRTFSSSLQVPSPSFNASGLAQGKRFWNALALAHQRFLT